VVRVFRQCRADVERSLPARQHSYQYPTSVRGSAVHLGIPDGVGMIVAMRGTSPGAARADRQMRCASDQSSGGACHGVSHAQPGCRSEWSADKAKMITDISQGGRAEARINWGQAEARG
jgi:hypothetical protein